MAAVHIRNVPDETVALLKKRAADEGRSLEAELRIVLDHAAYEAGRRGSILDEIIQSDAPGDWEFSREDEYADRGL
ncbi:hypothetical protein Back2_23580 [Nocardioides baekrokdamisoli]|uniref:Antitoxin FitA-like ribbon-helix-helix domain-containing protein n=1 Tax=Nocardioides baekrokdamisoli TaxID=1804624 RepID=A0A3G9IWJ9_9ACTN|nr:plasmid stabilization protein [Nocardioides baekrokdamisoli]BBH18071.1 hypothetical protein Back2_23580 [Nocardioides baekrokdamisoli]